MYFYQSDLMLRLIATARQIEHQRHATIAVIPQAPATPGQRAA